MKKYRVLLDMDDTIADFAKALPKDWEGRNPPYMYEKGFFENLEPIPGALLGVQSLYRHREIELEIVTKPVALSPISYTEKVNWIAKWFPYLLDKITMTQDKANIKGDILIDDHKWEGFEGKLFLVEKDEYGRIDWETLSTDVYMHIYHKEVERRKAERGT